MAKTAEKGFNFSENFLSLGLGILVVIVIGALIFNYLGNRPSSQKEKSPVAEEKATEEEQQSSQSTGSLPTKHKVAKGEDLWKIAQRYYKSGYNWIDIAKANNLTNPNILLADTELTIPDAQPKVLAAADTATQPAVETSQKTGVITGDSYTVVRGDNLWQVAVRAYGDGFKWTEIAKANDLINPDLIHAGNVLKLPR